MTLQNREIPLPQFLGQVRTRVEQSGNSGALILFDTTLQTGLRQEFQQRYRISEEWAGTVDAGDFDHIYPLAAGMLRDSASSLYSEAHPDSYLAAHEVSEAFCGELNEVFQATEEDAFELLPIKSWADMMVDAGLVTIENGMVIPTLMGTETAQDFGRGVERE
ncbi:MAG: hypothetical protein HY344_04395 [Candidatus Levybacteria bacterium]|nr:hypothetical protein [Candidatus Levybacteria bacterium]